VDFTEALRARRSSSMRMRFLAERRFGILEISSCDAATQAVMLWQNEGRTLTGIHISYSCARTAPG
jgi:hypothetical protein